MSNIYACILVLIPLLGFNQRCNQVFDCKPIKGINNEYALELTLSQGELQTYSLELYDLYTDELIAKKSVTFNPGESKVIFEKLKPSTYTIVYSSEGCFQKKSIKGKGIVLSE